MVKCVFVILHFVVTLILKRKTMDYFRALSYGKQLTKREINGNDALSVPTQSPDTPETYDSPLPTYTTSQPNTPTSNTPPPDTNGNESKIHRLSIEQPILQSQLIDLHQQNITNCNFLSEENTQEILNIFDGIDNILLLLLKSSFVRLSDQQCSKINKIIQQTQESPDLPKLLSSIQTYANTNSNHNDKNMNDNDNDNHENLNDNQDEKQNDETDTAKLAINDSESYKFTKLTQIQITSIPENDAIKSPSSPQSQKQVTTPSFGDYNVYESNSIMSKSGGEEKITRTGTTRILSQLSDSANFNNRLSNNRLSNNHARLSRLAPPSATNTATNTATNKSSIKKGKHKKKTSRWQQLTRNLSTRVGLFGPNNKNNKKKGHNGRVPTLKVTKSQARKIISTMHDDDIDSGEAVDFTYCFARNNTFIHSIFGQYKGQIIFNVLYAKSVVGFIFTLFCLIPCIYFIQNLLFTTIYLCTAVPIIIIYFSFHLLSVNKKCLKFIMKRFEFWLKIFYGLQFIITFFILNWETNDNQSKISLLMSIQIFIATFLMITLLAVLDGLQFKRSMRAIFGITISTFYTIVSIYYGFYHEKFKLNDDVLIPISFMSNSSYISVRNILSSSGQILALFFWKVTILSVYRYNRCSLVTYSPFIKWERNNNLGKKKNNKIIDKWNDDEIINNEFSSKSVNDSSDNNINNNNRLSVRISNLEFSPTVTSKSNNNQHVGGISTIELSPSVIPKSTKY